MARGLIYQSQKGANWPFIDSGIPILFKRKIMRKWYKHIKDILYIFPKLWERESCLMFIIKNTTEREKKTIRSASAYMSYQVFFFENGTHKDALIHNSPSLH